MKNYKYYIVLLLMQISVLATPLLAQEKAIKEVAKTTVCMVDDEYKGEEQLTTTIEGKTYYGCCIPCIESLNEYEKYRYAIDPFSGKRVNKAVAFIIKKSKKEDAIIYFESEENALKYLNQNK